MEYTTKNKEKSQIEIRVTVTPPEYQKELVKAAERLSARTAVKGFRKGHVPYDLLKREVGEMKLLQEALEAIIQTSFYEAMTKAGLATIGMPNIQFEKVAPGNDIVYTATVALLPKVTLPDLRTLAVTKKSAVVDTKKLTDTLEALRGLHATEVIKTGPAQGTDKLVIDMDMSIDKVPVDGGQARNYQVYLSENHYIPGFNEQVSGLKKDEVKEFSLSFPKEHYQKHLAGKTVDFKVTVKDVYERQLPELNDALAKKVGQANAAELRELIQKNLMEEAEEKVRQQAEIAVLDTVIDATTFEPIPDVIIDNEKQKMFYELKRDLDRHGVTIEQYLSDIKKKEDELLADFTTQAERRAKAALVSRQVAQEQAITVSPEELDQEIQTMTEMYKDNTETIDTLKRPEVRDTIMTTLQNRKVVEWLKERIIKEEEKEKK